MVRTARPRPARYGVRTVVPPPGRAALRLCVRAAHRPRTFRVCTENDLGVGREQVLVGARKGRPQLRELRQHALRDRHVRLLALPPRLGVSRARRKEAWVEDDVVVVAHHYANVRVVDGALANERRRGHGVGVRMLPAHAKMSQVGAKIGGLKTRTWQSEKHDEHGGSNLGIERSPSEFEVSK